MLQDVICVKFKENTEIIISYIHMGLGCSVSKLLAQLLCVPGQTAHQLRHPWSFHGKSTGVGCRFLLQHIWIHTHICTEIYRYLKKEPLTSFVSRSGPAEGQELAGSYLYGFHNTCGICRSPTEHKEFHRLSLSNKTTL